MHADNRTFECTPGVVADPPGWCKIFCEFEKLFLRIRLLFDKKD